MRTNLLKSAKKIFLSLFFMAIFLNISSCNKESNDNPQESNATATTLPITIDYHQILGKTSENGETSFNYQQNGLIIETEGEQSSYAVKEIGKVWLYSKSAIKISNIESLAGLKKISLGWHTHNSTAEAILYGKNGNIIDIKNDSQEEGTFNFENNLEQASFLIIRGNENEYYSIIFE